jgi:hypothetical protein
MSQTAAEHEKLERRYRTRRDELIRLLWGAPAEKSRTADADDLARKARRHLSEVLAPRERRH